MLMFLMMLLLVLMLVMMLLLMFMVNVDVLDDTVVSIDVVIGCCCFRVWCCTM